VERQFGNCSTLTYIILAYIILIKYFKIIMKTMNKEKFHIRNLTGLTPLLWLSHIHPLLGFQVVSGNYGEGASGWSLQVPVLKTCPPLCWRG
jgi:hypothetical protein